MLRHYISDLGSKASFFVSVTAQFQVQIYLYHERSLAFRRKQSLVNLIRIRTNIETQMSYPEMPRGLCSGSVEFGVKNMRYTAVECWPGTTSHFEMYVRIINQS